MTNVITQIEKEKAEFIKSISDLEKQVLLLKALIEVLKNESAYTKEELFKLATANDIESFIIDGIPDDKRIKLEVWVNELRIIEAK